MPASRRLFVFLLVVLALPFSAAYGQRQMEKLGRGVVAVRKSSTETFVSWRLLGNDPEDVAFDLYRSANGGAAVKVNATPLTTTTNLVDTPPNLGTTEYTYSVKPLLKTNGIDYAEVPDTWANPLSGPFTLPANTVAEPLFRIPLQRPVNRTVHNVWNGDVDGDGEYEFIACWVSGTDAQGNWVTGLTQKLQTYKRDGTLLWEVDFGPNSVDSDNIYVSSATIAAGQWDGVTVYDLDGDGRSEVIVKSANGVKFGDNTTLSHGDNLTQFISVLDGQTGAELARAVLPNPWKNIENRPLGTLFGIGYPDGIRPSLMIHAKSREDSGGFHQINSAWDFRNGSLTQRWSRQWSASEGGPPTNHQMRILDLDGDGKDEMMPGMYALNSDGTLRYDLDDQGIVHGDRFHVGDLNPNRPGLEHYGIQQYNPSNLIEFMVDASTGQQIWMHTIGNSQDSARGTASDIDPAHPGVEVWSFYGIRTAAGVEIAQEPSRPYPNLQIWWDGDLLGENLNEEQIDKWNPATQGTSRVLTGYQYDAAANGRHVPVLYGDIIGDWREEYVCAHWDQSELIVFTTSTASSNRLYTLAHNPAYRNCLTVKGYVQQNLPDYFLGDGMVTPPPPPMVDTKLVWKGGAGSSTWDAGTSSSWLDSGVASTFADGDTVRFDISGDNSAAVTLNGTLQPGALKVYNPKDYTFAGTGTLAGTMKLTKAGAGSLVLPNTHPFTGKTTVWDGALVVNGNLQNSLVTVWGGTWGGPTAAGKTGGRVGGTGQFGQPVTIKSRGAIAPGGGMNSPGTLTFASGLTAEDGTTFALDLSDDPTGTTKPNDVIAVTGNLNLTGTTTIVINPLDTSLGAGTYTLATYGTLTGSLANLAVIVPAGTPYMLAVDSGSIRLIVTPTRPAASVTWRGNGTNWDLAASQNWLNSGSPDVFVAGDHVTFDSTGSAAPTVTLATALPVASVTVNASSNYTFTGAGSLTGSGGLTKSGNGVLTIVTANSYTGPTVITGGVLAVSALGNAGNPSAIGASTGVASNFILNGGTLRLTSSQTSTNRNVTFGASGGTMDIPLSNSSMQLSGVLSGSGSLTKSGSGTLQLGASNTYNGGTVINGGTILLAGSTANEDGLGSGNITLNNGTLSMSDVRNNDVADWNLIVPTGATGRLNADGRCGLYGSLTGGGDFTFHSPYIRTDLNGDWSAFTGRIKIVGGDFRIANTAGYANAALDIGAGGTTAYVGYINSGSATVDIGELAGSSTGILGGGSGAITWRVGNRNTDSTFAGVIKNGTSTTALTKNGTGTQTLTGANTYTGATTVSAGKLVLNGGSLTGTNIAVASGAGFGGNGSVTGNISFSTGAVLLTNPAAGPLAITGNLTFGGAVIVSAVSGAVLSEGTFLLYTYTGSLTGTQSFIWSGSGYNATFDTSVAGQVSINVVPLPREPADIVWTGSQTAVWDTSTANWNWTDGATLFQADDRVFFGDTPAVTAITVSSSVAPASVTIDAAQNYSFSGTGAITGSTSLTKSGTGTLTMSTAQTFTGGSTINDGIVNLNSGTGLGTGTIHLAGGTLAVGAALPTPINVTPAGGQIIASNNRTLSGAFTGDGVVTVSTAAITTFSNLTNFAGTINMGTSTGTFRANSSAFSGGTNWTLDLGTNTAGYSRTSSAATVNIGALSGGTGTGLYNGTTATTYSIGEKNVGSTFSGAITGNASIVKTGSASLTLAGANTYTGTTTVSNGALYVTGSLANTPTSVASGATIGGTGTLGGNLTLASGARLALGVGTSTTKGLTVSGLSTLTGNITVVPALLGGTLSPGTYTLLTYSGNLGGSPTFTWNDTTSSGHTATFDTSTAGQVKITLVASLPAPHNVAASSQPLAIALSWNAVPNATTYTVKFSTVAGGPYATLVTGLTSPAHTHGGLAYNTTRHYVISASNATGSSSDSTEVTASAGSAPLSEVESAPPSLAISNGNSAVLTTATSVSGHFYQLQSCADLTSGYWINIGDPVAGTGFTLQFESLLDPAELRRFYRILISR